MMDLSPELSQFINEAEWIFAKTYAKTWPHEYIVQEKVDNGLFLKLAEHIDLFGHEENFYTKRMVYFHYEGHAYWHMENIINRCLEKDTYQQREKDHRLPE